MTALSPPLYMAGVQQFADQADLSRAHEFSLVRSGTGAPDVEFVHRVGLASHRDPVCRVAAWPFTVCETAAQLVAFAERYGLSSVLPLHGDLVVVSADDEWVPGVVGIVLRVEEYAAERKRGPTRVELAFAVADDTDPRRMQFMRLLRWCGPSRGDVIIRWRDYEREAV